MFWEMRGFWSIYLFLISKPKCSYLGFCILGTFAALCFLPSTKAAVTLNVKYRTDVAYAHETWWGGGVAYPRVIALEHSAIGQNNVLLATFEEATANLTNFRPGYPIYRSLDQGKTWRRLTVVRDSAAGMNSEWQPFLFELPWDFGHWKAGTILLAACSIDPGHTNHSAIRIYASKDGGETWPDEPITVATGGGLATGVWEPFLVLLDSGTLVCYYSDSTEEPTHSQKIVYKTSTDGKTWSESVDVCASPIQTDRPGMPVVTRLGDGSYFMTFEVCGRDGNPVCYKTSPDGLNWGDVGSMGTPIVSTDNKALGSAPYCNWTPIGSDKGTLIVNGTFMRMGRSKTGTDYFISHDYGRTWMTVPHVIPYRSDVSGSGYSNSTFFSKDGTIMYAVNNPPDLNVPQKAKIVFALVELAPAAPVHPFRCPRATQQK